MPDRHKIKPKAVRMPDGLLARIDTALEDGETVNAFIVAAIEERLERRSGGSTKPATGPRSGSTTRARKPKGDTAPAATFRQPCPHPKARVIKGFCGACGTNVGLKTGGQ